MDTYQMGRKMVQKNEQGEIVYFVGNTSEMLSGGRGGQRKDFCKLEVKVFAFLSP